MDWLKEAPTLAAIGRKIPFTVPSGYYFDQLPARIENRIALENINTLVPSDGFTVPQGYFSDLSERINFRLDHKKPENKPVRRLIRSWISYSAAACISILIGSVIYFNSAYYSFDQQLSEVPDQEIINYLQVYSTMSDTPFIIENLNVSGLQQITTDVSSEELEQYINNTTL